MRGHVARPAGLRQPFASWYATTGWCQGFQQPAEKTLRPRLTPVQLYVYYAYKCTQKNKGSQHVTASAVVQRRNRSGPRRLGAGRSHRRSGLPMVPGGPAGGLCRCPDLPAAVGNQGVCAGAAFRANQGLPAEGRCDPGDSRDGRRLDDAVIRRRNPAADAALDRAAGNHACRNAAASSGPGRPGSGARQTA